ncbi:MAG TPA: hypothetical protein VGG44_04235 [Tepidisphaeraceae bacterium]|jgi:hypothetical protein
MFSRFCAVALFLSCARVASAQIIYEPVRYQYGDDQKFYYGGGDPSVIAFGFANLSSLPLTIYTDARPYENAAIFGCTTSDARNQAYANTPRYFRKRDLISAGQPQPDGSIIIPAQADPIPTPVSASPAALRPQSISPQPILIIPHGQAVPPPPKSNNIRITMN